MEKALVPLTEKYAQLRDDLKTALAAGRAAEDASPKDDSFYNWDCVSIVLPCWDSEQIAQAAKEAGTVCFRGFFKYKWFFLPNTGRQGIPSILNTEAMAASLCAMGYKAAVYGLKK